MPRRHRLPRRAEIDLDLRQGRARPGTSTASTTSSPTSIPRTREVQAEILKIMGFWIQLGVSGFRMDAVPFVIAEKGADVSKPHEQYDMLRHFRELLQWRQGDAIILGEANVLPETDMEYFGDDGDRLHMMFNFQVNQNLFYALATADTPPADKALQATRPRPATSQWGMFLRNHDELDLGRLTRRAAPAASSRLSRPTRRCSSTTAASAGAWHRCCRRSAAARTRLQPDADAARHARAALRRRDRHGRRPAPARARLRPHADAVVRPNRTAASPKAISRCCR